MKSIAIFLFLSLSGTSSIAQELDTISDLRLKIDSIIQFQIKYKIDSTTDVVPVYKWDFTAHKGLYRSFSSFPPNPMTGIILNGQLIAMENLNQYRIEDVRDIKVYLKNDPTAMALYGSTARNGLIIITLKK